MPADDLDDLLRQAMKSLDDQVPSGYFEALPDRALARLEASMHSTGTGTSERGSASAAPPPAAQQEENSGLHDIRNLAQSTKQRLSSRRSSAHPIVDDDDVLAATSAGWKAVALPAPAKMVSLPELDELPSKAEVLAKEKAAAKDKAAAKAAPAPAVEAPAAVAAAAAAPAPARHAARTGSSKGRMIALAGVGVAAAAGVAIFFAMQQKGDHTATQTAPAQPETRTAVAVAAPVVSTIGSAAAAQPAPAEPAPAAAPAAADGMLANGEAGGGEATGGVAKPEPTRRHAVVTKAKLERGKDGDAKADTGETAEGKKETSKNVKAGSGSGSGSADPSFDELLKEAGADKQQKVVKPHLAKKELTADDFKAGMDAVTARAQACYKGTQGLANLTIVIAPSGHVANVIVKGPFAGKPEGQCVSAAVRGATFPPWDGGPQRFVFPILLSE